MKKVIFIVIMLLIEAEVHSSSNRYFGPVLPIPRESVSKFSRSINIFGETLVVYASTRLKEWQQFVANHANQFTQIDLTHMDYNVTHCENKVEILADLAAQLQSGSFPPFLSNVEIGYIPLDEKSQKNAKIIENTMAYLGDRNQASFSSLGAPPKLSQEPLQTETSGAIDGECDVPLCSPTPVTAIFPTSSAKSPIELGDSPTLTESE